MSSIRVMARCGGGGSRSVDSTTHPAGRGRNRGPLPRRAGARGPYSPSRDPLATNLAICERLTATAGWNVPSA